MSALNKKHEELLEESQQVKKEMLAKIEQLEAEQKGLMKRLSLLEGVESEKEKLLEKMKRSLKVKEDEKKQLEKEMRLHETVEKRLQQEKAELLKRLKNQRVTTLHWQYRVDRLLEIRLCRNCVDAKNDAYANGLGYTWLPDCVHANCGIVKSCLQAGLPGHDGQDEFVTPIYWDEDATLKSLEKELGLSMTISLANLNETIEKEKKKLDETPEPKPTDKGTDDKTLYLQQDKVTLLHDLKQQRTMALHWQYRMDRLMDLRLCQECIEEKDDAYSAGKGFAWVPNCKDVDCVDFRRVLRAGLPDYEDELIKPDYWKKDAMLAKLDKQRQL